MVRLLKGHGFFRLSVLFLDMVKKIKNAIKQYLSGFFSWSYLFLDFIKLKCGIDIFIIYLVYFCYFFMIGFDMGEGGNGIILFINSSYFFFYKI